jgi:hypothetical protein
MGKCKPITTIAHQAELFHPAPKFDTPWSAGRVKVEYSSAIKSS